MATQKKSQNVTKSPAERLAIIEAIANSSNLISVNNGNAKTGKGCLTISFPTCACREDAPCKKGCYCMKGRQQYSNVLGSYFRNLRIWREDPQNFEEQLCYQIKFSGLSLIRYCSAGDIPDANFLDMMFRVAKKFPKVNFLAYTKKYEMVNDYLDTHPEIPDNLTIRFSYWHVGWRVDNRHNLPVAYVDFKDQSLNPFIPSNAYKCKGGKEYTCTMCQVCFKKQVQAVVFKQH